VNWDSNNLSRLPAMKSPGLFLKAATPVASIVLALAGILQLRAQFWVTGGICIGLAVIGFMTSMRLAEKTPFTPEQLDALRPFAIPAIAWLVIASLLSASVVYVADNFRSAETDRVAEIAWVSALLLSLLVTWRRSIFSSSTWKTLFQTLRANRTELAILSTIMVVAFALRTLALTTHPYPWSGDEISIGIEGRRILQGEVTNYFETGWSSQPNWSFIPTAITEVLFGKNILAIRIPSVLAGTLAVLFLYLTARELFNPHIALMSAAILAALPYHLHFSRVGVHNVFDSFMSALVFWLLARGYMKSDPRWFFSAGIVAGLCIYTYAGTRLALILSVATLIFFILRDRKFLTTHWQHLVAFAVGGIISAAPQAAFFARHPDIFMGRFAQEGILFNGWLTQHAAQTGRSALAILFDQFTRTFLVFISSPALGNFFNSPYPYLTLLGGILFLLGMGYALAYVWEPGHFIVLLWFWSVIVFGGILTLNPPANTRMLMTAPPVALLIAVGIDKVLEYPQKFGILPVRAVVPIMAILVGILTYQNASFYMGEYRTNTYFQDANGEYAMEAGLMAKTLGKEYQIYSFGSPRIFTGFPTFTFLAPENPKIDMAIDSVATLELPPGHKAVFFASPENRTAIEILRTKYPGGVYGIMLRKSFPQEILFEYYILNP
jgi:4-amino-4-deoxy-L-arabinose transferase-like glycosyltransferase